MRRCRSWSGRRVSTERARLPAPGDHVTFEDGDCRNVTGRVTLRVAEVRPGGKGLVVLAGWRIAGDGHPAETLELSVPVATVETRRRR